jgi:hypothetical protein
MKNRTRRTRWTAGLTMAGLAAVAAIISYNDGLFLIRLAGVLGRLAYLYPLLPDGLIVISSLSLYEAAVTGARRPRWAMAGIILGALLTVAMNVAAGASVSPLLALADGFVPVVFFVALEILIGLIRRGRATVPPAVSTPVSAGGAQEYRAPTQRKLMDELGVGQDKARRAQRLLVSEIKAASNGHGGE